MCWARLDRPLDNSLPRDGCFLAPGGMDADENARLGGHSSGCGKGASTTISHAVLDLVCVRLPGLWNRVSHLLADDSPPTALVRPANFAASQMNQATPSGT